MISLGIESTAHTLGVGICDGGKILANVRHMYRSPQGEGMIPRKAADHHAEKFAPALKEALSTAGVTLKEVDLYSFSRGPGIGQCLRVSCSGAKFLASKYRKPILGINHCHAHLQVAKGLLGMKDPLYVYVSGANTQLITENKKGSRAAGHGISPRFSVLGETLDMGLGNLFDVFAREAAFPFPHGSEVAKLAEKGSYFPLPYTVKGMNFAFAGLLTSALRATGKHRTEDICRSLTETAFAEICEASERALCLTKKKEVTVCGGVAQNRRFCEMLSLMCEEQGARFGVVAPEYNADNGAMIAYAALHEYKKGKRESLSSLKPDGYWRIDEVE
ncbi:tRNA N6-adenosine threonylcarbamoyltransferase [uncultured archaeon]|nr:tRNA N6-adenosine threonylcarbamoyltransferase [uncultured archaeon]